MLNHQELFEKYQNATMIPRKEFTTNLDLIRNYAPSNGAFIECGTWRGGMAAAMVEIAGNRDCLFFDSFQGLPPAQPIDGPVAALWQAEKGPSYYNNCSASLEEFMETLSQAGDISRVSVHRGWFEDVFPQIAPQPVAALRIDADWYDPTIQCLRKFWSDMVVGGLVILDDYYAWEGCAIATHQFLHEVGNQARIHSVRNTAYLIRGV